MDKRVAQAFIEKVYNVFPRKVDPPQGSDVIVYHPDGADYVEEVIKDFSGKLWRELPPETLFKHRLNVTFMTDAAFRYYLPAFMRAIALYEEKVDLLPDIVVSRLDSESWAYYWPDDFQNFVNGFEKRERILVAEFLELYLRDHDLYECYAERYERIVRIWKEASK